MKYLFSHYAENSVDLEKCKNYVLKFLQRGYIYQHQKTNGKFLVRKGNEYFVLIAEETFGGGVNFVIISGVKERPNVLYFSNFWDCMTGYTIERSRSYMKDYVTSLTNHNGLGLTEIAELFGYED